MKEEMDKILKFPDPTQGDEHSKKKPGEGSADVLDMAEWKKAREKKILDAVQINNQADATEEELEEVRNSVRELTHGEDVRIREVFVTRVDGKLGITVKYSVKDDPEIRRISSPLPIEKITG